MREKKSLWLLVGSEEGSGNAENSGMLLLTKTNAGYRYAIADGNNILKAKGSMPKSRAKPVPDDYCIEDECKPECGAVLAAVEKEGLYKTQYVELAIAGDRAEKEFFDLVRAAGRYLAIYNWDSRKDDDRYVVIRPGDNKVVDMFSDSGAAYERMCELNRKEAVFFPQLNERDRRYTDVWVIGASMSDVVAMANKVIFEDDESARDCKKEYLFTDGRADGEALTFRTEYRYVYAGRVISRALPGSIVFVMDSWESFGFAAYKNGHRYDRYILNFDLEGVPDIDRPGETSYSGTITACRKEDGKELFWTSLYKVPARYVAGLAAKSTWSFDAARGA